MSRSILCITSTANPWCGNGSNHVVVAGKASLPLPVSLSPVHPASCRSGFCRWQSYAYRALSSTPVRLYRLRSYLAIHQPTARAAGARPRVCDARSPEITGHMLLPAASGQPNTPRCRRPARLLSCGKGRAVGLTAHEREQLASLLGLYDAGSAREEAAFAPSLHG